MKLFYDLHMHSCLSPCGGDDMSPANLAAMCALAGLQVVALTDHNSVGNCRSFCAAAQARGLLALPGMELSTVEEVHVICLFPDFKSADGFGAFVDEKTAPWQENNRKIFGPQLLMDDKDTVLGEDTRFLAGASGVGIYEVTPAVKRFGGVCYPAHIDRGSFSLLSNLGLWDPAMGFPLAEISHQCPPDLFERPDLRGVRHITDSDAHYLDQIPDALQLMNPVSRTAEGVLRWLDPSY
ncbi:MAG: PHP domain-containing protein [Oscillospiraceae bacterium]